MMKIQKPHSRKLLYITLAVLLLVTLGAVAYYYYVHRSTASRPDQVNIDPKPTDTLNVKDATYSQPAAEQTGTGSIATSDKSAASAAFPTTQPNLTAQIVSATQKSATLVVDTEIKPKTDGACVIELTRIGFPTISKTTALEAAGEASRCADSILDVASAEPGEWTLTVKVTVGQNVATASRAVVLK